MWHLTSAYRGGQTDGHVITWFFWSIGFCILFFHACCPAARASRAREFRYDTERCIVGGKVWCLLTFLLLNGVPFLQKRWGVMADRNGSWAEYFFSVTFNEVYFGWRLSLSTPIGPLIDPTAMPCWWALIKAKQLSMTDTAGVIRLCACVR